MPPGEDDVTIYGEFRDAISARLERLSVTADRTARDLDKVALAGEVAAAGMDRSSASAGRLQKELAAVDRAAEQKRLTDLRAVQVEAELQRLMSKGVMTREQAARADILLAQKQRDQSRAAKDLRDAHIALGHETANLARRIVRAASDTDHLTTAFGVLRGLSLVEFFSSLTAGVGALGAELVGMAAGLAPLLGVVGGIPALGLAAVTTAGSLSLLTGGAGKALGAMVSMGPGSAQAQQALSGLSVQGRVAAGMLTGVASGLYEIRQQAFATALPYLQGTAHNLLGLMPALRGGLVSTTVAVAQTVEKASAKVSGLSGDVRTILSRNARLVGTLGDTAVHGIGVLDKVMLGAGGMVQGLAQDVDNTMGRIERYLTANPQKVSAFFDRVESRVEGVAHVLKEWGIGLVNIFKGATPMVDHLGGSFTTIADRFAAWTGSEAGQERITRFFRDAVPLATAIAHLIGQIGIGLGHLATASGGQGFTSTINGMAALVGPLTDVLTLIDKIITKIPGGGTIAAIIALSMGLPTPFGRLPGIGPRMAARGVGGLIRGGWNMLGGVRGVEGANTTFAGRLGMRAGSMLGIGGAAAGAEEGAVGLAGLAPLIANPIGLAVAGAVGLGALGGVLYAKWRPFHDMIDGIGHFLRDAFGWVEQHLPAIGRYALLAFAPITIPIKFVWDHLHDIENLLHSIGHLIAGLPGVHTLGKVAGWFGHNVLGLYTGGPVMPGGTYLTGELGPELLVAPSGMRIIGGDGAEILRPNEPGFVLPNESLVAALSAIPSAAVRAQASAAVPLGGSRSEWVDDLLPEQVVGQIGPFYGTQNEAQVRAWVTESISRALADRDRRRRDRR